MDGEVITAARTAAGSALSARLLARADAAVLAILGTGVQARAHGRALARVRALREVRVAGRDPAKAAALAAELGDELGVPVAAAAGYREAMAGADIVCACTHSPEPVVAGRLARAGDARDVGRGERRRPRARRRDGGPVAASSWSRGRRRSRPSRPARTTSAGRSATGRSPPTTSTPSWASSSPGTRPGRTSDDQITLYKSVGVAAQDAAAAALVLAAAGRPASAPTSSSDGPRRSRPGPASSRRRLIRRAVRGRGILRVPGRIAQLGERPLHARKVTGSSPVAPTFSAQPFASLLAKDARGDALLRSRLPRATGAGRVATFARAGRSGPPRPRGTPRPPARSHHAGRASTPARTTA